MTLLLSKEPGCTCLTQLRYHSIRLSSMGSQSYAKPNCCGGWPTLACETPVYARYCELAVYRSMACLRRRRAKIWATAASCTNLSCGDSRDTTRLCLRGKWQTSHAIANLCDQEVPSVRGRTRHTGGGGTLARLMTLCLGTSLGERTGSQRQLGPPLPFVDERKQERPAEPRRLG